MISTQMARWRAKVEQQRQQRERRERIATAVMQGILSRRGGYPNDTAQDAIQFADALIKELDK